MSLQQLPTARRLARLSPLALTILALPAAAQFGKPLGRFDVEGLTGNQNLRGIEFGLGADPWNPAGPMRDFLWATGTRTTVSGPHFLYQIDVDLAKNAALRFKAYAVPKAVESSPTGLHDLAYDEKDNVLYAGTETRYAATLFAFDCRALKFDAARDVKVTGSALATFRALAFDAAVGEFFIADGDSQIACVLRSTGSPYRYYSQAVGSQTHGLAFGDHRVGGVTRSMAAFGRGASGAPSGYPGSQVAIRWHGLVIGGNQYDATGSFSFADGTVPAPTGVAPGGLAGGLAHVRSAHYGMSVLWCLQHGIKTFAVPIAGQAGFGSRLPDQLWYGGVCRRVRRPLRGQPGVRAVCDPPVKSGHRRALVHGNRQQEVGRLAAAVHARLRHTAVSGQHRC